LAAPAATVPTLLQPRFGVGGFGDPMNSNIAAVGQ
jgi:hypothetical protein